MASLQFEVQCPRCWEWLKVESRLDPIPTHKVPRTKVDCAGGKHKALNIRKNR